MQQHMFCTTGLWYRHRTHTGSLRRLLLLPLLPLPLHCHVVRVDLCRAAGAAGRRLAPMCLAAKHGLQRPGCPLGPCPALHLAAPQQAPPAPARHRPTLHQLSHDAINVVGHGRRKHSLGQACTGTPQTAGWVKRASAGLGSQQPGPAQAQGPTGPPCLASADGMHTAGSPQVLPPHLPPGRPQSSPSLQPHTCQTRTPPAACPAAPAVQAGGAGDAAARAFQRAAAWWIEGGVGTLQASLHNGRAVNASFPSTRLFKLRHRLLLKRRTQAAGQHGRRCRNQLHGRAGEAAALWMTHAGWPCHRCKQAGFATRFDPQRRQGSRPATLCNLGTPGSHPSTHLDHFSLHLLVQEPPQLLKLRSCETHRQQGLQARQCKRASSRCGRGLGGAGAAVGAAARLAPGRAGRPGLQAPGAAPAHACNAWQGPAR